MHFQQLIFWKLDGPIGFAVARRTFQMYFNLPRPPFGGTPFNPITAWRPTLSSAFCVCSGVHYKWEMPDPPSKRAAQGVSSTDYRKYLDQPLAMHRSQGSSLGSSDHWHLHPATMSLRSLPAAKYLLDTCVLLLLWDAWDQSWGQERRCIQLERLPPSASSRCDCQHGLSTVPASRWCMFSPSDGVTLKLQELLLQKLHSVVDYVHVHRLRPLLSEMQWITRSEHALCSPHRITNCISNFLFFIYHAHWINHLFWRLNQKNNIPIRLFPECEILTTWPKHQVIHDVLTLWCAFPQKMCAVTQNVFK